MSKFIHSSHASLSLRQQYLASLEEPQEWFLEELVGLGQVWTLEDGTYGVTHVKTLVEFVSAEPTHTGKLLRDFQGQHGFSTALVKSYDHGLVRACEQLGWTVVVGGLLFRKRKLSRPAAFDCAVIRATISADVHTIWQINGAFFESEDEVADLAGANKLWTAIVDGEIAGCGVSNRVIKDSDAVDIGMMVAPNFRRKGLGTYIVSEIADRVEIDGLRPICGCGASNVASRATLEKAGFVSEHQLLSFTR